MGLPHMYDRSAFFPQQDVNFCFIINFINLGEQQIFGGDCIFAGEPQSIESSLPRAVLIGGGPWPLCAMTCGHLVNRDQSWLHHWEGLGNGGAHWGVSRSELSQTTPTGGE